MSKQTGITAMKSENYCLPIENEQKLQKTEFAWWSSPGFIIFLTIAMSTLDGLVLYDILDQAMTQSETLGVITSFGIALVLNMMPLLIAKFMHQAIYKIKKGATVLTVITTLSFFLLFAGTVWLRFAYQDQYGETSSNDVQNEVAVEETLDSESNADAGTNPKGFAVVLLLSVEPLVTSLVNFGLAFINHLRKRRLELAECEGDLRAYMATVEEAELRRNRLLLSDHRQKLAAREEIHARCCVLKAVARTLLAEYLRDPESASYVVSSMEDVQQINQNQTLTLPEAEAEAVGLPENKVGAEEAGLPEVEVQSEEINIPEIEVESEEADSTEVKNELEEVDLSENNTYDLEGELSDEEQ
jgi:hypothetical protein